MPDIIISPFSFSKLICISAIMIRMAKPWIIAVVTMTLLKASIPKLARDTVCQSPSAEQIIYSLLII